MKIPFVYKYVYFIPLDAVFFSSIRCYHKIVESHRLFPINWRYTPYMSVFVSILGDFGGVNGCINMCILYH